MPKRKSINRGDVVELLHSLSITATLSVNHPVAAHLSDPLELSIPAGAHAVVEKERHGEAYLFFPASDDVEVKRWVQKKYIKLVQ
jgi:hypothetical protein